VHEIAELNLCQGELLYKKKKLAAASDLFRKAFSYAKKENALDLIQKSSQYLTEISILTGEKDDAKDYFIQYRISSDSLFSRETAQTIMEMLTKYETEKKENENLLLIRDNENYHQNFNSFINELRIREARLLLTEPKFDHISIEGIGAMAGFSSKVTFHSNFKQQIGVTPSYFRKSVARSITTQVEPKV